MAEERAIALDKLARALNKLRDTGLPLNDWQAGKKYKVNYPVLHENKIYRCTEAHTASNTFDETKWEAVSNADSGLKVWGENTLYKTNDIVIYGNGIYQCITEHTSTSTFDNANWTNLSVGYAKKSLYTSTTYNTASTTVTTSESMLNKDFIIIKIAYSVDGTSVKMNKSYVISPVVEEVHDFSYQESTTSYIALTGKILNNTTLQFNFTGAQNLTKFKIISIDSLALGTGEGNAVYSDTPIGTVISYMGNNPPKDYLPCDGTIYNISDYQALADFINTEFGSYDYFGGDGTTTFAVPDLRGEFLRGTGTNSHTNQGNGANVGVHQDGTKEIKFRTDSAGSIVWPHNTNISNTDSEINVVGENWRSRDVSNSNTIKGYYTSRPTNTSVLYCIKYTNSNSPEKIDIWTANTSYSVGNIVIYNDKIYRCITANNDVTFIPLNWVCLSATGEEDIGHITFGYELQSGYLPLDGSTYNRADYTDLITWVDDNSLWASTATDYGKFGTGDGTTTFTTPNFTGKFIECADGTNVGDYTEAGLPNIKGYSFVASLNKTNSASTSPFYTHSSWKDNQLLNQTTNNNEYNTEQIGFNASRSSSIYSDSVNTVQPESIKLIPQIKYRKPNKSLPVKAVRRTLWEGEVGNLSNNSQVLTYIDIDDSFKNYDMLGFYITVSANNNTIVRPIYREISTEDLSNLIVSQSSNISLSMCWGYYNTNDYCDIQKTSTNTRIQLALGLSQVTKVVGIKYINENQYSTEEQLIGTWIDGKPLYQKTFQTTTPSTINTYGNIITNLGSINVTSITGYLVQSDVPYHVMINSAIDNSFVCTFFNSDTQYNGSICMRTNLNNWTSCNCCITVQYTKTTD